MKRSKPVVITGFMGSGKTSVARALAQILNCEMVDLDLAISDRERRTPKEIIELDGENAFREIETQVLREVLEAGLTRVIALGGGAWTMKRNRELITAHSGFAVWLDVPFRLCWQRISASGNERPLARNETQARKLYRARRAAYIQASLRIEARNKSFSEVVKEIVTVVCQ